MSHADKTHTFDVFLSHSSVDKAAVETIARRLVEEGHVRPFLDAWDLVPGEPWQERLEHALGESAACAVFVGASDVGPWANEELRVALDDRARNPEFRVIPVLLPGASPEMAAVPRFLRRLTWCDFRAGLDDDEAFGCLLAGVRGVPPGPSVQVRPTGSRSIDRALFRLGTPPYAWVRRRFVAEASELLRSGHLPVVFRGLPGIGKTTLLSHTALAVGSEFEHVFAMTFGGPSAIEPGYVLEELNEFLTTFGRGMERSRLWEREHDKTFEALALDLSGLDVLMLLDAVDRAPTDWQRRFLVDLARVRTIRVAATIEHEMPSGLTAHVVVVPPLEREESLQLIDLVSQMLGIDVDADALVERLPDALSSHPQALVTLLTHLRDLPLDLLLMGRLPDDTTAPSRLTEQAVASLDADARAALALADTLSGLDLRAGMKVLDLASPPRFRESIALLQARSLLQRRGDAHEVPALVRTALAAVDDATRDTAASLVADGLERAVDGLPGRDNDLRVLAQVTAEIACNLPEERRGAALASVLRAPFLDVLNTRGYWKEYAVLVRVGLETAAHSGDITAEVELGSRLARKLWQIGDVEGGYEVLRRVERRIGSDGDSLEHAKLYDHRALLRGLDDDTEGALVDLVRSREIRDRRGDTEGLTVVYKVIGNVHLRRKDYTAARQAYEAALNLPRTESTEIHRLETETSLGVVDLAEGRPQAAETRLRKVIEQARTRQFEAGIARASVTLALAVESQERLGEALAIARDVLAAPPADPDVARAAEMVAWRLELESKGGTE